MLSKSDLDTINDRVELGVRRYFDHYLAEVFPKQMKAHNQDCSAHSGVSKRLSRLKWFAIGAFIASGGVTGAELARWLFAS